MFPRHIDGGRLIVRDPTNIVEVTWVINAAQMLTKYSYILSYLEECTGVDEY